ncbi:conserved hypothetical protein [Neospora caninum Liverpool]|uniref:Proteophosphoglycan 5, related n=1 Tax=Neospora caninum (strain Liverpool) TaxID=572307 RepID=F0VJL0_NEOCL|nr:conserved hypothetical protein [Neospora caninum Liverpool]CBZ53921.1 conserved hypothetical protein [Neospora caninum Liverpool]CEL67919.1 TPA: hypothetical protein BN1204_037030 [Neospora caninum Liverpool]|eukprot:XP_003883953.1 conserved hypothetical protein [Neospora caninum Liverpool]
MKRVLLETIFLSVAGLWRLAAIRTVDAQWGNSRNGRWGAHRATGGATLPASFGSGSSRAAESVSSGSRGSSPPLILPSSTAASGGTTFSPYAARTVAAPGRGPGTPLASAGYTTTPPLLTPSSTRQGPVTYPSTLEPFPSPGTSTTLSPVASAWAPRPSPSSTTGTAEFSSFPQANPRPAWSAGSVAPSSTANRSSETFLSMPPQGLTSSSTGLTPNNAWSPTAPVSAGSSGDWSIPTSGSGPSENQTPPLATHPVFTESRLSATHGTSEMSTWGIPTVATGGGSRVPWTGMSLPNRTDVSWSSAVASTPRASLPSNSNDARPQSQLVGTASQSVRTEAIPQASSEYTVSRSSTANTAPTSSHTDQQGGADWITSSSRASWSDTNGTVPSQPTDSGRGVTDRDRRTSASSSEGQATVHELPTNTPFPSGGTTNGTSSGAARSSAGSIDRRPWEATESATFPSSHISDRSQRSAHYGSTNSVRNSDASMSTEASDYASNAPRNNAFSWGSASLNDVTTETAASTSNHLTGGDSNSPIAFMPGTNSSSGFGSVSPLEGPLVRPIPFSTNTSGDVATPGGFRLADSSEFSNGGETISSTTSPTQQLSSPLERLSPVSDRSASTTSPSSYGLSTRGTTAMEPRETRHTGLNSERASSPSLAAVETDTVSSPGQSISSGNSEGARYDTVESRVPGVAADSTSHASSPNAPNGAWTRVPNQLSGSPASSAETIGQEASNLFPSRHALVDHLAASEGILPSNQASDEERGSPKQGAQQTSHVYRCHDDSQCVERSGMIPSQNDGNVTTLPALPSSVVMESNPNSQTNDEDTLGFQRAGYIPPSAFQLNGTGASGSRAEHGHEKIGQQPRAPGELLYGELNDYLEDAEDPYAGQLGALSRAPDQDNSPTVSTTTTSPPYTYPPTYNPYSDNIDVDKIPDSPYHNYAYAEDPFPSPYSTHSRLENYGAEFNNRYYHERRIAPNISWGDYTQRKKALDEARKREEQLLQEGRIGVLDTSDTPFQGLIGYPSEFRRTPTHNSW